MSSPPDKLAELRNTVDTYEKEYQEKAIKLILHYSENNNNYNNNSINNPHKTMELVHDMQQTDSSVYG